MRKWNELVDTVFINVVSWRNFNVWHPFIAKSL